MVCEYINMVLGVLLLLVGLIILQKFVNRNIIISKPLE